MKPVILVPGILASRLMRVNRKTGEQVQVWFPIANMSTYDDVIQYLWGRYDKNLQEYVSFQDSEWQILPVPGLAGIAHLSNQFPLSLLMGGYEPTIKYLESLGYTRNVNIFAFPYDWRQDPTGTYTQVLFQAFVHNIASRTGQKVVLVGHSMGSVVIKAFIQQKPTVADEFVDKFISVGGAFNGCASNFINLHREFNVPGFPSNQALRGLMGSMPSVYSSFPHWPAKYLTRVWIKRTEGKANEEITMQIPTECKCRWKSSQIIVDELIRKQIKTPQPIINELQTKKATKVLHIKQIQKFQHIDDKSMVKDEVYEFFTPNGNNFLKTAYSGFMQQLVEFDPEIYNAINERMKKPITSKVKMYSIISIGVPTPKDLIFDTPSCLENLQYQSPRTNFCDGDGFVQVEAAQDDGFSNSERTFVKGVPHGGMLQNGKVLQIVEQILKK
ncbi:Lecithin-cholesterol_acyltransferase [Hexamita inflata]|uniref:Lecithin-cholesterol acyltransferase n=1 Tax=Hexamita inflata TaxID=28002 RepID=A0AA86RBQ7_9EUKA|nr:Lecithin-cholesterol acyltransferase [Hexamita inflata]